MSRSWKGEIASKGGRVQKKKSHELRGLGTITRLIGAHQNSRKKGGWGRGEKRIVLHDNFKGITDIHQTEAVPGSTTCAGVRRSQTLVGKGRPERENLGATQVQDSRGHRVAMRLRTRNYCPNRGLRVHRRKRKWGKARFALIRAFK